MSASLVGSEMCIRDSRSLLRKPALSTRKTTCCTTTPRRASIARFCASPVSYTHLTLPTICSV
eukprot:9912162-Alexandrium_andersonii.AAC.1